MEAVWVAPDLCGPPKRLLKGISTLNKSKNNILGTFREILGGIIWVGFQIAHFPETAAVFRDICRVLAA